MLRDWLAESVFKELFIRSFGYVNITKENIYCDVGTSASAEDYNTAVRAKAARLILIELRGLRNY